MSDLTHEALDRLTARSDSDTLRRRPIDGQDVEFGDARLPARFWSKVRQDEGGCWLWTAQTIPLGYGRYRHLGRSWLAHRASYSALVGNLDRLVVDHLCRTPGCVRPSHLEAVSISENNRRGLLPIVSSNDEWCRNGLHRWTPDNIVELRNGDRKCLRCHRECQARYDRRRRA